jgi:heme export protein D (CcmD)
MRNRILTSFILACTLLISNIAFGQDVAPAQGMRSNGKIYVVMAVCITILTGLIIYLISIDRKIGKIEKQD